MQSIPAPVQPRVIFQSPGNSLQLQGTPERGSEAFANIFEALIGGEVRLALVAGANLASMPDAEEE